MNAYISFDVSNRAEVVIARLRAMGYYNAWVSKGVTYFLPSHSLWKPNCELSQAKNDLVNLVNTLNVEMPNSQIVIQRCIVLSVTPWDGLTGSAI